MKQTNHNEHLLPITDFIQFLEKIGGIRVRSKTLATELASYIEHNGLSNTSRQWGINRVTLSGYPKGRSIPLSIVSKLHPSREFYMFPDVRFCAGRGGSMNYVRIPTQLTSELAYLIGALRDGYVGITKNKDYFVTYIGSNQQWLSNINKRFLAIFGISLKFREGRPGCYYLERSLKPILYFINYLFDHPLGDQKEWLYPKILTRASEQHQWAHIAGIVDAEGHLRQPHEASKSTTISQTNILFTETLQRVFRNLGVETTTYPDKRRENALFIKILAESRITFLSHYVQHSQHPTKKKQAQRLLTFFSKKPPRKTQAPSTSAMLVRKTRSS
jgi:intein/homing endonuclease